MFKTKKQTLNQQLLQTVVERSAFKSLEKLGSNQHLIFELQKDKLGNNIRIVAGKKIIQIEKKTQKIKN